MTTPRVAVAGFNPHNGEGGTCGREEIDVIAPAVAQLNAEGAFPFDELITTYRLDEINEAEHASHTGEVIKPVFLFD